MGDVRDILEGGMRDFEPGDRFKETVRRGRRRERIRRATRGVAALAVAVAGWFVAWNTFDVRDGRDRLAAGPFYPVLHGTVRLPAAPSRLAWDGQQLWVTTDAGSLVRVDPATGIGRVILDEGATGGITVAFGSAWVGDASASLLRRIDLSGDPEPTITEVSLPELAGRSLRGDWTAHPDLVTSWRGHVIAEDAEAWTQFSIDPATHEVEIKELSREGGGRPRLFLQGAGDILWGAGATWGEYSRSNGGGRFEFPNLKLGPFAATSDALWFGGDRNYVRHLGTGAEGINWIDAGDRPEGLAATDSIVWVLSETDGTTTIRGFDENSGELITKPDASSVIPGRLNDGGDMAGVPMVATEGRVWVADREHEQIIWFDVADQPTAPPQEPVASPVEAQATTHCTYPMLVPTYIPPRFEFSARSGPGGPAPGTGDWPGLPVHYRGPGANAHITLTHFAAGPDGPPQRHPAAEASQIDVAGGHGTIGPIQSGYSVEVKFPEEYSAGCDFLWILAYGPTERQVRRFAEGLRVP